MKTKLLKATVMLTKRFLQLLIVQALFYSLAIANEGITQNLSINEIYIELHDRQMRVTEIFNEIEARSQFKFTYEENDIADEDRFTFDSERQSIYEILSKIARKTSLSFRRLNDVIDVSLTDRKSKSPPIEEIFLEKTITGKVTDENGQALPGVNVLIKGSVLGTVTDLQGNYRLDAPDNAETLVFSYIGYLAEEVQIAGRDVIDVTLVPDIETLEEIVVIGYGVKKRKDLTGAVESISSKEIEQRAVTNVQELLRGRVSGLNTTISNSADGGSDILIRGKTSINASNAPLIVLDGMIYYGSISDININDIESIDVLKDASSAAIFGARSSSGVIIITTKKGTKGKPVINISSSFGISKLVDVQELKGPEEYISSRVDFFEITNPAQPPDFYRGPNDLRSVSLQAWRDYDSNIAGRSDDELWFDRLQMSDIEFQNWQAGNITDWFDEATQVGLRQDHSVSISGANDKSSHYFSINYVNNDGFVVGQNFESIRTRFNLETKITDFLTLGTTIQFSHDNNAPIAGGGSVGGADPGHLIADLNQARVNSPFADPFLADGTTLKRFPHNDNAATHPFYNVENSDKDNQQDKLVGNIFADIKLPLGFKYRINWINNININHDYNFGFSTPERTPGPGARRRERKAYTWNIDHILTWQKLIGEDHELDATFLFNAEKRRFFETVNIGQGFLPSEELGFGNLEFASTIQSLNRDGEYQANALMARINYTFKGKYLFTASVRRDGYSAFGANNQTATFPSGAFAWRVSDEDFFNTSWVDNLKLRVSWGENGNRSIPLYRSFAAFGNVQYLHSDNGASQTVTGFSGARLANPDLVWESTEAINVGMDFSILNGLLSGSIEYYNTSTTDLLITRRLPNLTGYKDILTNIGEIQNNGVEVTLNAGIIDQPNFSWNSYLLYSANRNKIKELFGEMEDVLDDNGNVIGQREADDVGNGWFIGQDLDVIYDFEIDGVYRTDEETEAAQFGLSPGNFRIKDQNGDGEIVAREDERFLGHFTPRHRVNLRNDFTFYKNFELSIGLDAQLGHMGRFNGHFGGGYAPGEAWQAPRLNHYSYPYWTPDNQLQEWAKVGSINPFGANYYESLSFVRIQNVTLSYRLPKGILEPLKIQAARFSLDFSNLAVFTKWDYWDPELVRRTDSRNNPPARPTPMIATARLMVTL